MGVRRLLLASLLAALTALPWPALAQDASTLPGPFAPASPGLPASPAASATPGDPAASPDPAIAPDPAISPDPAIAPDPAISPDPAIAPDPAISPDPAETSAAGLPYGTVRLMAVGDVMLGRSIGRRIRQHGPGIVFRGVRSVLDDADLFVVNLECDITTSIDREDKHYTFKAPPIAADALSMAGVDVASVANNHAMDWGRQGLTDTLRLMADRGIATPGGGHDRAEAHAPVVVRRNGLSIAFLAYVDAFTESTGFNTREWKAGPSRPGLAIANVRRIRSDVARARELADLVVVLVHAGWEYVPSPNSEQRAYARAALDAGATLYLGHHPHVLQAFKREDGKLIAWSLGNFVFDGMDGASVSEILSVDLTRDGVKRVRHHPVRLVDGLPTLVR